MLEPEQEELLRTLVEAVRAVHRSERRKFRANYVIGTTQAQVAHPGLPAGLSIYFGDVEELARHQLVQIDTGPSGETWFDVTSLGIQYCDEMIRRGDPVERIQDELRTYVTSEQFKAVIRTRSRIGSRPRSLCHPFERL